MFKSLEVKYPKFYQVFRFIIVIIASVLYAWNLRCFAKVADLLPGGFSGVSLLFQAIGLRFFYISIPFTIFNVALNIFPAYIAYRYIGKKFTIYSIVVIILSSVLVDILPPYIFTEDILLIWRNYQRICNKPVPQCRHYHRRNRFHKHLFFSC